MTSITIRTAPELAISAAGHATGSVEACAAVSVLLYALRAWIEAAAAEERWPDGAWEAEIAKGAATLRMPPDHDAAVALRLVRLGLTALAETVPGAVRVTFEQAEERSMK